MAEVNGINYAKFIAPTPANQMGAEFEGRARVTHDYYTCNATAANFWAKYAERFPWTPRDVDLYRRFWLARARRISSGGTSAPPQGNSRSERRS